MKHVKDIILEKKIYEKYRKYNDFLVKFFKISNDIREVKVYEEYNAIYINIKYDGRITNEDFLHLNKYFEGLDFYFTALSSSALWFTVENVKQEFFDEIDIQLNAEKYNI